MKASNNIFAEKVWETSLYSNLNQTNFDYSKPIVCRRALIPNLFTVAIAFISFSLFLYLNFSHKYEINVFYILGIIAATIFLISSIYSLLNNSREIKIDKYGITLNKSEIIKWPEIKATFIRKRSYYFTRGSSPTIERFYLEIETEFSGIYTKKKGMRLYEITGLNHSEMEIEQYVELFKTKFTS